LLSISGYSIPLLSAPDPLLFVSKLCGSISSLFSAPPFLRRSTPFHSVSLLLFAALRVALLVGAFPRRCFSFPLSPLLASADAVHC
jgi:hypothetical protein